VGDTIRPVLVYDGGCRLCRFAARGVVRLDRRQELRLLRFEDVDARPFLDQVPDDATRRTWLLVAGERIHGDGRGAVELARAMRITRPAARPLAAIPAGVLDALYGLVARNRTRLGRLVPDGPAPRCYP